MSPNTRPASGKNMRRLVSLSIAAATAVALAAIPAAQSAGAKTAPSSTARQATPAAADSVRPVQAAKRVDKAALAAAFRGATTKVSHTPHLDAATGSLHAAKDGTVRVAVVGDQQAVAAALKSNGGKALAFHGGATSAVVAKSKLAALAQTSGVSEVKPLELGYETTAGPSEAVSASLSGAQTWINSNGGTGAKVAVVDLGFADIATEETAGHLVADTVSNTDCPSTDRTQHGTAVAEVVHQMAPAAEIIPICVDSSIGFATAVDNIVNFNATHPNPIQIATSSLGFPNDSRGDGSDPGIAGDPSTAASVAKARKAGVLWIQSAGNEAIDHWGGNLADANHDGLIDLHGTFAAQGLGDDDAFFLPAGGSAAITMQYDQWQRSNAHLRLDVLPEQCETDDCTGANDPVSFGNVLTDTPSGIPTMEVDVTNNSAFGQLYDIEVEALGTFPVGARYDLFYFGDVSASLNACSNTSGTCDPTPRAVQQSMSAPANSPFALAVGAHDVHDGVSNSVELFSSQGPTIDNRVKPDITGWDGTASWLSDFNLDPQFPGFYGTSAAAPHVAGAAALVLAQHPAWEASQVQNFLEQRADSGSPSNPPTNQRGYGLLTMGDPTTAALPAQGQYQALGSPVRVLDTRNTTGGHHAKLAGAGQATVNLASGPGALPSDATAVAINLTGIGATNTTFLSVFPGGTTWPKTSNLNMAGSDSTAAVFAIVSVNALRSIIVRNNAGLIDVAIDEVGFFRTNPVTGGLYNALPTANRVLDTRNNTGGHFGKLPSNGTVEVDPQAPTGATAAIVNITSVNSQTSSGYLAASPTCSKLTSTLNFNRSPRANLAIVGLDGTGKFCLSNNTGGVDAVVDVLGFMGTNGATYIGLPAPKRIMDTRTGNGPLPVAPLAGGHSGLITSGTGEVPGERIDSLPPAGDHTVALFTGVTEASATGSGYLQAFAGSTRPVSPASTLNFSPGRIVPNAAVVGLNNLQFGVFNSFGNTAVAVDLFGYFVDGN